MANPEGEDLRLQKLAATVAHHRRAAAIWTDGLKHVPEEPDGITSLSPPHGLASLQINHRTTGPTLGERPIAAGAEQEGKPLSERVEPAILDEVARSDLQLIEEWERALSGEDQAVLAALAGADLLADLDP